MFEFGMFERITTRHLKRARPGVEKIAVRKVMVVVATLVAMVATTANARTTAAGVRQQGHRGTPYHDSRYHDGAQKISGRVQCAYYDLGGEGVAYHDSDGKNNGSGTLNPADGTYLNEFRMYEGVDTSYTKFHDEIDNNKYDLVQPPKDQLYVGWTVPGEWFRITVQVAQAGLYEGDLLYTSEHGGTISLDLNGKDATGPVKIESTRNAADPIAWRQWHHWNLARGLVRLRLPAGKNVLTVHILTNGNMNLAYFDFAKAR